MELSGAEIRQVADEAALLEVWPVLSQLRTHLDADRFLAQAQRQFAEGWRCTAVHAGGAPRAVAGWRIETMLHRGRSLYVDDLVSDALTRGQGYGRMLLDWLKAEARRQGCRELHLDSGVQRFEAHAFYFAQGLRIGAYHFAVSLDPE